MIVQMHQLATKWLLFTLFLFASCVALAQAVLTPESLLERYGLGEVKWSADGQRLAVVVTHPVTEDGQAQHIWIFDKQDDLFMQLTRNGERNFRPRWSPDGILLAFLSARNEEEAQIYLMSMRGGEAYALTAEDAGVESFEWSPAGESIAFDSADPQTDEEKERTESKFDERVASKSVKSTHLRLVDIASKEVRPLTEGAWRISNLTWRPDGTALVVSATDDFSEDLFTDRFFVVGTDDPEMSELARPDGPFSELSVSPDDRFLAYIGSTDGGPIPHGIFLQPLDGGSARDLTGVTLDRRISSYLWEDDATILALTVNGLSNDLVRIALDGVVHVKKTHPGQSIPAFDTSRQVFAYVRSSASKPDEVWIEDSSGERKISRFGDDFPDLIEPDFIQFTGEDGLDIEAAVFKPKDNSRPREGWPTVLLIHSGPSGRFGHFINDWAQLLVARGFAVVAPNIRGSVGYGLEFLRANRNDWGGADYQDAIAAVDYLIAEGIADPEALAIAGWSYGGYMSAWAVTQTDRFKAAIAGAAMTDLAVEYGTELASINAYDTWYLGSPYERPRDFARMSPMTFIKNAATPTLILIGEEDRIDPIGQNQMFYRGLKRYGVETEMIIYPREPHTIKERNHRIDVMNRMVDWIKTYVN